MNKGNSKPRFPGTYTQVKRTGQVSQPRTGEGVEGAGDGGAVLTRVSSGGITGGGGSSEEPPRVPQKVVRCRWPVLSWHCGELESGLSLHPGCVGLRRGRAWPWGVGPREGGGQGPRQEWQVSSSDEMPSCRFSKANAI